MAEMPTRDCTEPGCAVRLRAGRRDGKDQCGPVDPSSLRGRALSAAVVLRRLGLTQQDVAQALGASQSQVSRILAGRLGQPSKLFEAVCVYAETLAAGGIPREAIVRNDDLLQALAQTWDGTTEHARQLAAGIRSMVGNPRKTTLPK